MRVYIISLLFLISCNSAISYKINRRDALAYDKPQPALVLGVAKMDITPPPGLPMAGYSLSGNYSEGVRHRLFAKIVYMKEKGQKPVVFVAMDLLTGSEILHHKVAEIIADTTDVSIGGIVLSGTHTHAGPGNYFGNDFYNDFTSNGSGFNAEYFQFLANRISGGIKQAYEMRAEGRVSFGKKEIYGYTRNRSVIAFQRNKDVKTDSRNEEELMLHAVNPVMTMIRLEIKKDGKWNPISAFTNFSVHGTTLPTGNTLNSGDVFSYIERELEEEISRKFKDDSFLHAVTNATHGDNSPNYYPGKQGFRETERVGTAIGKEAVALFNKLDSNFQTSIPIRYTAKEVDILDNPKIGEESVCERAMVGMSLTAGAEDGPTFILNWLPPFAEGYPRYIFTGGCHAEKRFLLSHLQKLYLWRNDFPRKVIFQFIQVGDFRFVPLPFEVTRESGNRIRNQIEEALAASNSIEKKSNKEIIIISCSNGYFGYATTREEYSHQDYEGGHTIYGPGTTGYLAAHTKDLAQDLVGGKKTENFPTNWDFVLKTKKFSIPSDESEARASRKNWECVTYYPATKDLDDYFSLEYLDIAPGIINIHLPLVQIKVKEQDNNVQPVLINEIKAEDTGKDLEIRFTGKKRKGLYVYEIRWYKPIIHPQKKFIFRILERRGQAAKDFSFDLEKCEK